ncbi:arginine--tRNA ligase [Candidatus Shapirobacteria bacterium]|nr:arginine--tRNA ligase [Candidatus Shapirobacteria bacterium]
MKFEIDNSVFEKFPNLVVAIPIIYGFDNHQSVEKSVELLRSAEESLKKQHTSESFFELEKVTAYEKCFSEFGTDPKVFAPAHVALSKRVLEGGLIPDINPMVNLYNSYSITNIIPFGGEDLDKVYGNFRLFIAKGGEKWFPIGAIKSKSAVEGELVWGDGLDLSTRALNWRQCERTKLTSESTNGYFVMDGFRGINDDLIKKIANEFVQKVKGLFGGTFEILWLDKDNPTVEIDFVSKKVEDIIESKKKKIVNAKKYYGIAKQIFDVAKMPVEHPAVEKFGDYAVRGIANFSDLDVIERVDTVAGFSNLWIKESVLIDESNYILSDMYKNELENIGKGKTVIVEYSSPNIAKPFGIGHLRSTNIGHALYNIYKVLGWNTIGDNHLGDWGTQFGKMITAIKHWGMESTIEGLEKLYVRFHAESENDKTLIDEGRDWFAKLEKGDVEARKIWRECIDISIKEFNRVYEMLGVKIDNAYGEEFYLKMLSEIEQIFRDKKLSKISAGAEIVEVPNLPPAMILKSDGATTYFTRDLATIKFRKEKWNPDLIIYEVGSEQTLHFKQVFAAAKLVGWEANFVHIGHGLIRWKDGKFSTRKGDTIHLSDIIDKAMDMAKSIAPENDNVSIAKVAIGAVKFNDLSSDPKKDIVFDWDRVMSMEGNSSPYLQYTYARCKSVILKSKHQTSNIKTSEGFDENETPLLRYFYIFKEKIVEAGERYNPAVLAEYLLNLARKYNEFYGKCRVIGDPQEGRRVFLTAVTAKIIRDGLNILGIGTLEKM